MKGHLLELLRNPLFHCFSLLGLILPSIGVASVDQYCEVRPSTYSAAFLAKEKDNQLIIARFSNHEVVAKQADLVLSKMVKANSSTLRGWVTRRGLDYDNPEQLIREWRMYHFTRLLVGTYLEQPVEVRRHIDSFFSSIHSNSFSEESKKTIGDVFNKAKSSAQKAISQFPISEGSKAMAIDRVSKVDLYWPQELKKSKYAQYPLEFLQWGAAYDPKANQINVGLELLKHESEESLFAVFAHELGHAIDPCRWGAFITKDDPFIKIHRCLRGDKSGVGALSRDDSKLEALAKLGKIPSSLFSSLKLNPTCNHSLYPPRGLQKDQLPEAFADWFSAQVIAVSDIKLTALRNDLCNETSLTAGSSYPLNRVRLENIYLGHPLIRKRLGLTKTKFEFTYCSF